MNTEINITRLVGSDDFVPFDLSNNAATLGANAGQLTWEASKEAARDIAPPLLDTEERKEAFRDFVRDSGAWSDEEIALLGTIPDHELAEQLGRTHGAVRLKREKLNIPNPLDRRKERQQ